MSDNETVEVPFGDSGSDTATLLLAAAQELDLPAGVVKAKGRSFVVPAEVAKKAGIKPAKSEGDEPEDDEPKRAAKKTAAKKSANKDKE